MAKQVITVPASKTPQTVTIETNDPVITIAGGTPLDQVIPPPVVVPPITPPVIPPTATGYTLSYSNGYDKDSDLDHLHEQLGKGTISTTVTKNSAGSFKGIVNVGDDETSSGFRSENQYMEASQNPKEGAVQFDFLLESLTPISWGGSNCQWHPGGQDNSGSALFFMEVAQQKWNMYCWKKGYYDSYGKPTPIVLNKWYHIRHEFNWSLNSDGYWRVYIDGLLYWSFTGATQISKDQPYFKLGFNFFSGATNQKISVHGGVGYWDNLVIEKKN